MKAAFLQSIKYMYPQGVDNLHQMRDLIRIYSMGWCDALTSVGNQEATQQWLDENKTLADLNWSPDESWKWW